MNTIDRIKENLEYSEQRKNVFGLDIRPIVDKDDLFLELMDWPTTFPLAARFLNHYSIQLMTSHLIMVPPNPEKRNIGWHDDGGTPALQVNGIRAFGSLKVGFFLTDLLQPNMGSLMVVPGSHRIQGAPPFEEGARDPVGARELKVRAGDAVIFQQGVWHAGAPNLSTQTRCVLYYGYNYRIMRPIDYDRMPAELLEKCSPIGRQLLGHKVSHLGYYIPTDEDCPLKQWYIERFGETWPHYKQP
jgi:ectoine hydroxylase-related dioxygenase (phytanoyl-CoA dioxygenase family)